MAFKEQQQNNFGSNYVNEAWHQIEVSAKFRGSFYKMQRWPAPEPSACRLSVAGRRFQRGENVWKYCEISLTALMAKHQLCWYNLLWQLTVINDDLLKLWEQTQAENTRLRLELSGVKNENETLKHQLGSAAQQAITLHWIFIISIYFPFII